MIARVAKNHPPIAKAKPGRFQDDSDAFQIRQTELEYSEKIKFPEGISNLPGVS